MMRRCSRLCCIFYYYTLFVWMCSVPIEVEAAAASSSPTPIQSSPEKIRRRRRRRIGNDNDSSLQPNVIAEKASPTAKIIDSASPPMIIENSPSQETIERKRKKRKSRSGRKEGDETGLSSLPNIREEGTNRTTTLESNDKLVQTKEDIEINLHNHRDDDHNNTTTTSSNTRNMTEIIRDDKDNCEAAQTRSRSQSNVTNIPDEETSQERSLNTTKAIRDKSQVTRKKSQTKKPTASKSTTTTASTGKGGECLRRIKHEWKDAVKSGIAYDWINLKTIRNTNSTSSNYVRIGPFGKNLLRWHFSVAGPANSVYENGIYHGRVLLPKDYPMSPPRVQMLTPSGRFIPGEDICLSASSYHPETWTPRWTVLSLVDALRIHMLTTANEIGGVLASDEKRRQYAIESRSWKYHGIANHEHMVAENIFTFHNSDNNDCEEKEKSEESNITVEDSAPSTAVTSKDGLKDEQSEDITSDALEVKASPPSVAQEKDQSKRAPMKKKKKKKQLKSKLSGVEEKKHADLTKEAVISSSLLVTMPEQDNVPKPAVETKAKKQKKPKITSALETVEQSTRVKESNKSKAKKNNKQGTDLHVQVREHGILAAVLKRLLVELLKLPLRVLAILIQVLDRLEKCLRAILDSI